MRGVALTSEQEQRLSSCADVAMLDRWLERAVHVTTAAALFED